MKKLLFILVLFIASAECRANDPVYKMLGKLYVKNPDKCLKRSKLLINYFPEKPTPYYFASKVSNDKTGKLKSSTHKYRNILNAIAFAEQFEKHADSNLCKELAWDEFCTALEINFNSTFALLDKERNDKLTKVLSTKWDHFQSNKPQKPELIKEDELVQKNEEEVVELNITEKTETEVVEISMIDKTGAMFGMPNGTENIPSYDPKMEKKLLELINAERIKKGMKPLEFNEDLARACRYHAKDLGTQNYFNHDTYDLVKGKLIKKGDTFDRIRSFYNKTFVNSENIAAGSSEASGTYEQWYNSKGHYANMFNSSSKKVGIGVIYVPNSEYGYYWVFCTAY